jgi:hypothetical protein
MITHKYDERIESITAYLREKALQLDKLSYVKNRPSDDPLRVSTSYDGFEEHGMLPSFSRIKDPVYMDALFKIREDLGRDILVSDLAELQEARKSGKLESFLGVIKAESPNSFMLERKDGEVSDFLNMSESIKKFYISEDRITFFSGAPFYFDRSSKSFFDYKKITTDKVKVGELVLDEIAKQEYGMCKHPNL